MKPVEVAEETRPRVMTVTELAQYLRISKASVYRLVRRKQIPASNVGRQLRFRRDAIDHWLEEKESRHYQPRPPR